MAVSNESGKQKEYVSYLLRMWRESSAGAMAHTNEPVWRASLQCPRSGRRLAFANLEELFLFLQHQAYPGSLAPDGRDDE
jgi:hypothetical protein